jgi:hypothetical protein
MTKKGVDRKRYGGALAGALALLSAAGQARANDADAAFRELRSEVPGLRADWNFETGYPDFIYGKPIRLFGVPTDDTAYEAAARQFVDTYPALFGYDSSVLATDFVKHVELSRIGTTDKTAVQFSQWTGGLPVKNGTLNFLFNADGAIVGIENRGLANVAGLDVVPAISETVATRTAITAFADPFAKVTGVEIAVVADGLQHGPALAWIVDLLGATGADGLPHQERFTVDAHRGGVLRRENTIHTFTDVIGDSDTWVNPGEDPYHGQSSLVNLPVWWMHLTSPVGNTETDSGGNFDIAYSGSAQQTVTFTWSSNAKYTWVSNTAGPDYVKSKIFTPGVPSNLTHNRTGVEFSTSQFNAAYHGVIFREWIRALDSTDNVFDIKQHLNVNINSTCNAYYNGSSTNFYRQGGGCVNTAYSTVVYHETGHWANDKYGSGNGGDGFGEGTADTWAMYIIDSPVVGKDFCGAGCNVRDGRNTRQYCGSCGAGCYGEVHADGEVIMGALWKVRDHLDTTNGDAAGDLIADTIFHSWYVTYNAYRICKNNLTQWLTLDDDNGNLADGTPHSADINQGYVDQGFPSYY